MPKWCYACEEWKDPETDFQKDRSRKDGLNARCRSCVSEASSAYERANRLRLKARRHRHYEAHKDEVLAKHRAYNKRNKAKNNQRRARKRREDVILRLRERVSRLIHFMITSRGGTKDSSVLKHLPYTIIELKQHLEKQFEPWMSWDNYGRYRRGGNRTWHIDHVIPQSLLPYDSMDRENFRKCWALQNLRPLESVANIRKSNHMLA